jgi:hypothetical protein
VFNNNTETKEEVIGWANNWDNKRTKCVLPKFVAEKRLGVCPLRKPRKWEDNLKMKVMRIGGTWNWLWQAFIQQYCPFYYNYCLSRICTILNAAVLTLLHIFMWQFAQTDTHNITFIEVIVNKGNSIKLKFIPLR